MNLHTLLSALIVVVLAIVSLPLLNPTCKFLLPQSLLFHYIKLYMFKSFDFFFFVFSDWLTLKSWWWIPSSTSSSSSVIADLVVRNAVIYTSDESLPFADSMAVLNGRILRLGNFSFVQVLLHFLIIPIT
jgi:hypothetical protein